jgi:hypothetical protein
VDLALYGQEAIALLQGKRLNPEMTAWEQFQPALKKGTNIRANGPYELTKWKPTKSKKLGKLVKKGKIAIYSHEQLAVINLPAL